MDPHTPREALLEIRRLIAQKSARFTELDDVAKAGLDRSTYLNSPASYEITDLLADRLAEAHKVLRQILKEAEQDEISSTALPEQAQEALILPPLLEAMMERRIGQEGTSGSTPQ